VAISVALGEDDYLVREGLRSLIAASGELELKAACSDYDSLLAAILAHDPQVVLTDIRMPPAHRDEGLRIAGWLRQNRPATGVVVLSQYAEPDYAVALLDEGSAGRAYLLKERVGDAGELVRAIRTVAQGGSVIDSMVVEALVAARRRRPSPLDGLTPREREVLALVAEGANNAAVAGSLGLSERAVEKHINSIFGKLGLAEETEIHRRVKATLLFLADR
jgi:DNA-binding NarL/FixJ family response regulator